MRKSWGYYATPSLNRRLPSTACARRCANADGRLCVLLVEAGHEADFDAYLADQSMASSPGSTPTRPSRRPPQISADGPGATLPDQP